MGLLFGLVSLSISQNTVQFMECDNMNCLYNSTLNGTLLPQQFLSYSLNLSNPNIELESNAVLTAWIGYLSSGGWVEVYFEEISFFDNSTTVTSFGEFDTSCGFNESCWFSQTGNYGGSCLQIEEDDDEDDSFENSTYTINISNIGTQTVQFVINLSIQEVICASSSSAFACVFFIYFGAPFFCFSLACCVICYACRRRSRCRSRGYAPINDRNSKVIVEQSSSVYVPPVVSNQPPQQQIPPSYSTNAYYQGPPPSYSVAISANSNYSGYQQPPPLYPHYQNSYPQPSRY